MPSELKSETSRISWRIRRFVAAETDLFDSEMVRNREKVDQEFAPTHAGVHSAMALRSLADESRTLSLMSRYESRRQRVHDKAYAALRELEQARAGSPSVSAGAPAENKKSRNERGWPRISATPGNENTPLQRGNGFNKLREFTEEPTAPPDFSPGIHVLHPRGACSRPARRPANRKSGGS